MKTSFRFTLALALALLLAGCGGSNPAAEAPVSASVSKRSGDAASVYHDVVQRIYVGYFGRPADPAGLAYWAESYRVHGMPLTVGEISAGYAGSATVRLFVDAFGTSVESQALYPGDNSAFVNAIYRNLYSREPDAGGKAFWVDVLDRGLMTRAVAALWIMSGAQSTDITIINNKVAVARAFTAALDTPAEQQSYAGMSASSVAREMLAAVGLATDPVNYPGIQSTIDRLTGNCGVAGCNAGNYLAFIYGPMDEGYGQLGLVSSQGGAAYATVPSSPGHLSDFLVGATIVNGTASNYYLHSMLAWKSKRLYRQSLVGPLGSPPEAAIVSSLNLDQVCGEYSEDNADAYDVVTPTLSYEVYRGKGADAACNTADDPFFAVRMDMGANTAPLTVSEPMHALHDASGGLTGFLVRNGRQIARVNQHFAGATTLFTLPGEDLTTMDHGGNQGNTWLYSSDGKVYAYDAAAAGAPDLVLTLAPGEAVGETLSIDTQDMFFTVTGSLSDVRVVRYNLATRTLTQVGSLTIDGFGSANLYLTPSRVLIVNTASGALFSLPRNGGAAQQLLAGTTGFNFAFASIVGERVWLHYLASGNVVSINSDGSGTLNFPGAYQTSCVMKNTVSVLNTANVCEHILMVEDSRLREYDGSTGALRLDYGSVPATPAGMRSMYALTTYALHGQGAVLTQVVTDPDSFDTGAAANYYFKVGQAGLTRLTPP